MARVLVSLFALALLGAMTGSLRAETTEPMTRTFAAPVERAFEVTESVLKKLGWSIDKRDRKIGWLLTDARSVDFREFGVYAEGMRHRLRLTVRPVGEGRASVAVERELYREERILWMKERKPVEASDRDAEVAVLDGIAQVLPTAGGEPGPTAAGPGGSAPAAPAPGSQVAARPPSRGEFTFKVTYRVDGTAGAARLTYRNAEGGTVQTTVRLPWEASFDAKGGTFLYVSAQSQGVSGSVVCEILLDGERRTSSTSTGAYVVAECSNAAERP